MAQDGVLASVRDGDGYVGKVLGIFALTTDGGDGPKLFIAEVGKEEDAAEAWLRKEYKASCDDMSKTYPTYEHQPFEEYWNGDRHYWQVEPVFGATLDDVEDTQNGWFRVVLAIEDLNKEG
jgi:hypothetical protein